MTAMKNRPSNRASRDFRARSHDGPIQLHHGQQLRSIRPARTGQKRTWSVLEPVSQAVHGDDVTRIVRIGFELLAQPADVDVHGSRFGRGLIAPHRVEQLVTRQHHAGMADQVHEQLELLRRQADRPAAAQDLSRSRTNDDVPERELVGAGVAARAPQQRFDARQQFRALERLGHVVVRAALEARDLVRDGVARGEHQHRHVLPLAAQLMTHLQAVFRRQVQVENDQVEVALARQIERDGAVGRGLDRIAFLAQPIRERPPQPRLVVHQQDPALRSRGGARAAS